MTTTTIYKTDFEGLALKDRGKVRDIYDLESELLIVATDRISAFDVVMAEPIPGKGQILTAISTYWFKELEHIVPNHLISVEPAEFPPACQPYANDLSGRSMLVKKAQPLALECIVRGYLTGSGYQDYLKTGMVCGHELPAGLQEASRLDEPIFAPSTKAERGAHDENITIEEAREIVGAELTDEAARLSLALYKRAREIAEAKGIIIADTKFEFGLYNDQLILIDEALTPDSSRFWPMESYQPGQSQPSFDKQYLRDYLLTLNWDKTPPPPSLPEEVINQTAEKYYEALHLLTGETI
ncbi:MAG: phosphoribosylaminoimidazolesuccinocarboxamide synthase [Deltaproteobacteria bacterium]|nr:phosphoribosylaminoimidazolesuccinocarboxamide synthase [Deltaproteobacteria bacterium]MBW2051806.1 phosphoribosylaminoimidazolesuccinocarboxamide synthase [Deltaproteobacteria bacterium]MBW2139650.1 phosphoribosylaminoimidazolesuccinocarboxamide synthase [Deltaproteobacteria bacterium]MBW2322147.1 phosphoribosylaminoimidazolesuccinocarboxamide synthase [Deltaproteobacteria bacterium]